MKLIDADALKEAIAEFHQKENARLHNPLWGSIGLNALNRLIDNAPTVPLPDFKEGYKQAILDGKTNFSRPQGKWLEWEDERWGGVWYYCSNCHNDALYKRVDGIFKQILSDYCPNCGTDMRGKKED